MTYWKIIKRFGFILLLSVISRKETEAQNDSLKLTIHELFQKGIANNLQLQADRIKEKMATERMKTARANRLPDINIGINAGILGQPIVFEQGLDSPTYPDVPDWSQNYAIDLTHPIYQGGKIKNNIRKTDIEQQISGLQTEIDKSDIKLQLLRQYMNLFTLYKQHDVLMRNIEESQQRIKDIRQMKKEGLITNNDVLRSELQLTNDRLSLQETDNNLTLISQQLDILLGLDESLFIVPDTTELRRIISITTYEKYVEQAYASAPEMHLIHKQQELAQNHVRLTKSEYKPKVALHAGNTLARPVSRTMADMYNNNWNVGLSVTYPLSSLYRNKHQVEEARYQTLLYQNLEGQQKQQIRVKIQSACLRHAEAQNQVKTLELSVRQAEENYRIMQNRYLNQLTVLTDLLDANNVRLTAELQLITAQTKVIYTYFELQKISGQLQ